MNAAGKLTERVAFDAPQTVTDSKGGKTRTWAEQIVCWAEFKYRRGEEAVEAGGLTGTASFKVRVRANSQTEAISTGYRLRDVRRGVAYNVIEVDAITDRQNVWLVAERGVAV